MRKLSSKKSRRIKTFGIVALIAILFAWPISFFCDDGLAIYLKKSPTSGWSIDFNNYTGLPGFSAGFFAGSCFVFSNSITPHLPPPGGPFRDQYGSDVSHWWGRLDAVRGVGTFATGDLNDTSWDVRTGVLFPFWPISLFAGFLLIRLFIRRVRSKASADLHFCPTCYYGIRAHPPGSTCPGCGTPIPSPPTPKVQ